MVARCDPSVSGADGGRARAWLTLGPVTGPVSVRMRGANHRTDPHPDVLLKVRCGLNSSCRGTWQPRGSKWKEELLNSSSAGANQAFGRLEPPGDLGGAGGDAEPEPSNVPVLC